MLVYMSVLMVIIGVGFCALYRSMDASHALSRNTSDIAGALHVGEDWRGDVRAAVGKIQVQSNEAEQVVRIRKQGGETSYRFAENTIFRRTGNNDWSPMLANVKASEFVSESQSNVTAWRWELELQPRSKKLTTMRPLFTFIAAPEAQTK
jgi:hypothetical protein